MEKTIQAIRSQTSSITKQGSFATSSSGGIFLKPDFVSKLASIINGNVNAAGKNGINTTAQTMIAEPDIIELPDDDDSILDVNSSTPSITASTHCTTLQSPPRSTTTSLEDDLGCTVSTPPQKKTKTESTTFASGIKSHSITCVVLQEFARKQLEIERKLVILEGNARALQSSLEKRHCKSLPSS